MSKTKNDNLRPFSTDQDREQARVNGRVGGLASGEARRRRKEVREFLRDFLESPASPALAAKMAEYGVAAADRSNMGALFLSVFFRAMNGDVKAARQVFEWAGMDPLQVKKEEAERLRLARAAAGKDEEQDDDGGPDVVIYDPETAAELFREAVDDGDVEKANRVLKMAGIREDGTKVERRKTDEQETGHASGRGAGKAGLRCGHESTDDARRKRGSGMGSAGA